MATVEARVSHLEDDIPQVLKAHGKALARLDAKVDRRFGELDAKVDGLESKMVLIMKHLGITEAVPADDPSGMMHTTHVFDPDEVP